MGRAVLGLYRAWARARDKTFSLAAGRAFRSFGRRSVIQLPVRVTGERRFAVGDDVFVGAGSWLQVLAGPDTGVALEIGDGTSIAGGCVLSAAVSVRLGRRVLLARNVYVSDHSHAFGENDRAVL